MDQGQYDASLAQKRYEDELIRRLESKLPLTKEDAKLARQLRKARKDTLVPAGWRSVEA